MTIYLDVLLLSNLWADYALLHAAARLTHTPLPKLRGLLGAMLGAVSALVILLPPLPKLLLPAVRLLPAGMVCAAAFGRKRLLRQTAVFLGVSMFFCGMLRALAVLFRPAGLYMQNTVIYADISLLTLLGGTAFASACAALWARHTAAKPRGGFRLHLRLAGQDYLLPAIADTGNTLCDAFTGKPVVVCPTAALSRWLAGYPDAEQAAASCRGFRMLPVRTVAGGALLPAFQPEYAAVCQAGCTVESPADVLIALTENPQTAAILPASVCG